MSDENRNQLVCKCGKEYKTKKPYLNHIHKCQLKPTQNKPTSTENIRIDNVDSNEHTQPISKRLAPDAEYLAQVDNHMKNDLQNFMNSDTPLPAHEPLEGENITVNTLVIETLLKTVLSQVLLHHHKHTQTIVDQNTKLVEENKMLVRMLRTIIYTKNNIKYELEVQSNDSSDENGDDNTNDDDDPTDNN